MSGQFLGVHPPPKKHVCALPSGTLVPEFTVWRCECGKAYRYEYGGSQYSESWYEWKRYEAEDVFGGWGTR
jgi:hypothetical protein